jgi:hypothetical protein
MESSRFVDYFGYPQCLVLENASARTVLCPHGGRVLEYAWKGRNAMYLDPEQNGWTYTPGRPTVEPSAGRFDIGPEQIVPPHPDLWFGSWIGQHTGPHSARLTSVRDAATGVQLVRDFALDPETSHLRCTQTIANVSDQTRAWSHWGRSFAEGGGICLVPLSPGSRFPNHYVRYGPGPVINYQPDDPNIRVRDSFVEVLGPPQQEKLGFDSAAGWFAYLMRDGLMWIKRFPVHTDRVYSEMAGLTISIWYHQELICELEPIGPRETLAPGHAASFVEEWWLLPYRYPARGDDVDLDEVSRLVERDAR